MDYRYHIARRYLSGRRSFSLITKITGISIAGVALGVAALIVVLSVMNGFFAFVRDMLVSMDPHVRIVSAEEGGLRAADSLLVLARGVPDVASATAYVEGKALLSEAGGSQINKVVVVRGVEAERLPTMQQAVARTGFGSFDLGRHEGRAGIVLGRTLGERLLLTPQGGGEGASTVSLLSATGLERMLTRPIGATPATPFQVRGLYELEAVFDESYVFVGIEEAQRLFRMGNRISGIDIRLLDLERAAEVKEELEGQIDPARFTVLTWYDLQKSLYDVMQLEKWGATLILALIIVVAAFNIVGSLTMIVIEKRRDVGVLQAMGVPRAAIRQIFLLEGFLIGLGGSGLGLVIGLLFAVLQREFGIVPLSGADSFLIDAYPVSIQAADVALIALIALVLCVAAAVYPATRAAAIAPARAVNLEG